MSSPVPLHPHGSAQLQSAPLSAPAKSIPTPILAKLDPAPPQLPATATLWDHTASLTRGEQAGRLRSWGYKGDAHILTCAKTRSGKGRHVILPNLVRYAGSVIVTDPKGENATETARWRAQRLGQAVHVLDPFRQVPASELPPEGRASFNPVHFIRDSARPFDDARLVAEALIQLGGNEPRWAQGAQNILSAFLLFLALDPRFGPKVDPETGEVGPDDLRNPACLWQMMMNAQYRAVTLKQMLACKLRVGNGIIPAIASKLLGPSDKEVGSLLSELEIQTAAFFSDEELLASMERTTISFGEARDKPSSTYLVLPFDRFDTHGAWLRMLLAVATRQLASRGVVKRRADGSLPPPVLFIMDEFDSMGRIERVRKGFAELAGYGVQFWAFVQNISQLKTTYEEGAGTIIGNVGMIQYFGGSLDKETRDLFSDLAGKTTIGNVTLTTNTRPESGDGTSQGTTGRPVVFPDEVGRIPRGSQLLFQDGENVRPGAMLNPDRGFADYPDYQAFMANRSIPRKPSY